MTTHTQPQLRPLVIIGAGGHAVSVANVAMSAGYEVRHFVDKQKIGGDLLGIRILGEVDELADTTEFAFAIAVGDNAVRQRIYLKYRETHPDLHFPALAHASAIVSHFTEIGDGTVLMPNAVAGPNTRIGKFCILNTQSSIDHDCVMLDFASLAPAAVVGGTVSIGARSAVSIGAVVKHGVRIGNDSVVGANSYVNKELPDNQVAYGSPAKPVRDRKAGEPYLK